MSSDSVGITGIECEAHATVRLSYGLSKLVQYQLNDKLATKVSQHQEYKTAKAPFYRNFSAPAKFVVSPE